MTGGRAGQASEAAVEAMASARWEEQNPTTLWLEAPMKLKVLSRENARSALATAHDPALGLKRSVCLEDVLEAITALVREHDGAWRDFMDPQDVADVIERRFTGEADDGTR